MNKNEQAMYAVKMRKLEIENPQEYLRIRNEKFLSEMPAKYHWMVKGVKPASI